MADTLAATAAEASAPVRGPALPAILWGQVRYANKGFWRTPVAAFFTLLFPLSFLVILSSIYGNVVIDESTGLRLAQFTTPTFAVFGACMACYVSLATALAYARASGVLKRLRGTPLPPALLVVGRVLSSLWLAAIAVGVLVGVGVTLYGVQIIGENVPALVLTFLVGACCFAALGFAVASAAPTPNSALAFANTTLILLGFISGILTNAKLPDWMDTLASVFPLKPFGEAFAAGFNPYVDATTPDWSALAVMAIWGIVGALITWRALSWEPSAAGVAWLRRKHGASPEDEAQAVVGAAVLQPGHAGAPMREAAVHEAGRPAMVSLVVTQARYAGVQIMRDPMAAFFGVLFPVILTAFFSAINGPEATWAGLPLAQYLCASFAVYGVATTGFLNLPGSVADHRAAGILKRLRGSPLPPSAYLAGRVLAGLVLGLVTVVLVFGVGVVFFDVGLPPARWAATVLVFALSVCCFAACGLALVAVVDSSQAVVATALSILLPLSFISDIFVAVEQMPTVLNAIGWFFPLRHAVAAAVMATSGGALDATFWVHLAVIAAWMLATALLAWRFFRWEPRRSAGKRRGRAKQPAAG